MKTKYYSLFIALIILISIAKISYAEVDTVLRVIPAGSVGWVRVNSLADLNEKMDEVMRVLTPPGEDISQGIILKAFSQLLSIHEADIIQAFEELGIDVRSDICVFWIDASFQRPLVSVHVKDKGAAAGLKSSGNFVNAEYQNVTYRHSDAEAFVILGDVLVYAQSEADIQKCIEAYLKADQSLLADPDYINLDARWKSDTNDLTGYIALGKVAKTYLPMLKVLFGGANNNSTAHLGLWLMEQAESLTVSAVLDEQGARMDHFLELKEDSPMRSFPIGQPRSLELLPFL